MKNILLLLTFYVFTYHLSAQIPQGYYDNAVGKTGVALQQALHDIIDNHNVQSYNSLWTHFQTTDRKINGKVWDMYSDKPNGTPPYEYTFVSDQCGSYNSEGDCYNREHSFPKSWFNDNSPMYSDLFHLYPTDGYVNGRRSNYPYGEVTSASWTSKNGSRLGSCATNGYSGIVFEPIDAYKGDLARTYFYMATRYYKEDAGWSGSDMVSGSQLKPWARAMMLEWTKNDPVSQKEIDRNNAIYNIQNNRNPFIDHPEYAHLIWGDGMGIEQTNIVYLTLYPNPTSDRINITLPPSFTPQNSTFCIFSSTGSRIDVNMHYNNNIATGDISKLPQGLYLIMLNMQNSNTLYQARIIKF